MSYHQQSHVQKLQAKKSRPPEPARKVELKRR